MNSKLRKNSLIVLIVALVLSIVAGLTLGFVNTKPVGAAYVHNVRYGADGVKDYNVNHWSAQGNRVTGETSGKWYFGHGDIETGSVAFTEVVATANSDSNSTGADFIGADTFTHHRFTYGSRLRAARYGATGDVSLIKWVAENDGYVKFTGVISKALASDNSSLVEGYDPANGNPWMNVDWSIGKWYDGASFTIGMWKANAYSANQVMVIDEVTYTSAFAYQVNPTGANIAVKAGDAIYFSYRCDALATGLDDWYNDSFCLLSSEFTAYSNTTAYSGDEFVDITQSGTFTDKMVNGQGNRTTGETSGYWNYTMGTISSSGYSKLQDLVHNTDSSYETINGVAQNPSNTGDTKRYTSGGYSNMILWGDEVVVNTRYNTMFEWTAEANGNVRFGGLVAKGHSDKGGLIAMTPEQESIKYYATNPAQNASDYRWYIGDSYTVGIYKVSGSTVTVISEKTFTNEYAYLIPTDKIAVNAGERIVFALKANTTLGGDYSTATIMMIDSQFSQDLDLGMSITKNMILQQNKNVNIWGTGAPGKTVTVSIDSQVKTATIDNNGDWLVQLDPMTATFTAKTMTITDGTITKTLEGILVGEVWFASGQSNMDYSFLELARDRGLAQDDEATYDTSDPNSLFSEYSVYTTENYSGVRIFTPGYADKSAPDKNGTDATWVNEEYGWGIATTLYGFRGHSAYGMSFALRMQQKLGIPIGIIDASVGGSSVEQWLSQETYDLNNFTLYYDQAVKAKSGLYNGMMYPVKNATINGFLWYQGCADSQSQGSSMADDWAKKVEALVAQVRREHGHVAFVSQSLVQMYGWQPFHYMRNLNWNLQYSIEDFYPVNGIAAGYAYDTVRPLADADGTSYSNDIHPADKFGIATDAANIALNYVYNQLDCMGLAAYPTKIYKSGNNVIIDYGAMENDSNNNLVLTSGTTVNNLSACIDGVWTTVTNATVSENKIIIPFDSATIGTVSYVAYAQNDIMATDAFTSDRVDHAYDKWYSDKPVNLFSANGVAAAPYAGLPIDSANYETGVSILAKQDFTMQYTFILKSGYTNPTVTFAYNGRGAEVVATQNSNGTYTASFSGIAPQDMNDGVTVSKITATDADGRKVDLSLNWAKATNFSVKDYLLLLKETDTSESTQKLIVNMLNYSAAAQTYLNHDTANLANASLSTSDQAYAIAYDETIADSYKATATGVASELAYFHYGQVSYNNKNGISVAFYVDDSIKANATLMVTSANGYNETVNVSDLTVGSHKGKTAYFYTIEGISITNYTTTYTFQIQDNGTAIGYALNYSMYAHISRAVQQYATSKPNYAALVRALYSYSQAVLAIQ